MTAQTIILYGSAGQSALVYVGNPEQQPGQQQTARPDQHVGLHHTFGESAQVDEQVGCCLMWPFVFVLVSMRVLVLV
eukprot:1761083-Rhodomonas_salina.10